MADIDTIQYKSLDCQRKILDEGAKIDVYDDLNHHYWVCFPKEDYENDSDESSIKTQILQYMIVKAKDLFVFLSKMDQRALSE